MIWTPKLIQARDFFREAHDSIGQVRKYTGENYWHHTEDVAATVYDFGAGEDEIIAALGHDTLEDVTPKNPKYSTNLLHDLWGMNALGLIVELTDVYTKEAYPQWNRAKRHALENRRLAQISPRAKRIKLADLKSNTASIVAHDLDFARVYLHEKEEVLPLLRNEFTEPLWLEVQAQLIQARKELDTAIYHASMRT